MKQGDVFRLARGKKPLIATAVTKDTVAGRYLTSNEQGVWAVYNVVPYPAALSKKEQDSYNRIVKGLK